MRLTTPITAHAINIQMKRKKMDMMKFVYAAIRAAFVCQPIRRFRVDWMSKVSQGRALSAILGLNAALVLGFTLSGCGSGAVGAPPDTTPVAATPLAVSPAAADIFPDVPVTFTISGGKPSYSAFTSNSVVLPVTATVTGATFTVIPGPVTAETSVDITVRDSLNASAAAKATVKPSTLINQITFTPSAPAATGCGTGLCSGNDAQVVVTAALNGVVLRGRQIRFDAFQGAFQLVTPGTNVLVNSLIAVTDGNGEAVVRVIAIAGAPTQVATLAVSDVSGGQSRKYSFNIIQQTSGVGILSVLPNTSVVLQGARGVSGGTGKCPNGLVRYSIFGGTPGYKVRSSQPQIADVSPAEVSVSGGTFDVNVNSSVGDVCGQIVFTISDASGLTIQTPVLDLQRGPDSTATASDPAFLVSPATPLTLCKNSTASVTLAGKGTFVAAISTSIPTDPSTNAPTVTVTPFFGPLPATVTFARSGGTMPASIKANFSDGKSPMELIVNTPPVSSACP